MPFPAPFKAPCSGHRRRLGPLPVACFCVIADFFWFLQALASVPRHAGSNVAMVSLVVWMFLHLPAALLVGGLMHPWNGAIQTLPSWSKVVLGGLGLAQTFALVYWVGVWRRRTR